MPKLKSYLITNIPESDWKRFKKWIVIEDFENINQAFNHIIKTAGKNKLAFYSEVDGDHTT